MKTIVRRLLALEGRVAVHRDVQGRSLAEVLRERRRLRLAAEGRPFEEDAERENTESGDPPRTIGEIIRRGRFHRRHDQS